MADPILIDCGGSTRIKRIVARGYGDLSSLLDVKDLTDAAGNPLPGVLPGTGPLPPLAAGSQQRVSGPFTNLIIMFQDAAGTPFLLTNPVPASFLIASSGDQSVRGDYVPVAGGGDLVLTNFSTTTDPLVEVKQLRDNSGPRQGRRRYVVANAGAIRTITFNDTPPPVFDGSNPAVAPSAPGAVGPAGGPANPAVGFPLYVSVMSRG